MTPSTSQQLLDLVDALNFHQVEYVLIGGWAAQLHGARTNTVDFDVLAAGGIENNRRLADALNQLGARFNGYPLDYNDFRSGNTRWFTRVGTVDILFDAIGRDRELRYADVAGDRLIAHALEHQIPVVSLPQLVEMKTASGRPKDLRVLRELHQLFPDDVSPP